MSRLPMESYLRWGRKDFYEYGASISWYMIVIKVKDVIFNMGQVKKEVN